MPSDPSEQDSVDVDVQCRICCDYPAVQDRHPLTPATLGGIMGPYPSKYR
jgi:hypothetical protein